MHDIVFAQPVFLTADKVYTLELTMVGPDSKQGTGGVVSLSYGNPNENFSKQIVLKSC